MIQRFLRTLYFISSEHDFWQCYFVIGDLGEDTLQELLRVDQQQ